MSVTIESTKVLIVPEFPGEAIGIEEELKMRPLDIEEVKHLIQTSVETISYINDDKFNKLLRQIVQREIKTGDGNYKTPRILDSKILWFTDDGRFILVTRL